MPRVIKVLCIFGTVSTVGSSGYKSTPKILSALYMYYTYIFQYTIKFLYSILILFFKRFRIKHFYNFYCPIYMYLLICK